MKVSMKKLLTTALILSLSGAAYAQGAGGGAGGAGGAGGGGRRVRRGRRRGTGRNRYGNAESNRSDRVAFGSVGRQYHGSSSGTVPKHAKRGNRFLRLRQWTEEAVLIPELGA